MRHHRLLWPVPIVLASLFAACSGGGGVNPTNPAGQSVIPQAAAPAASNPEVQMQATLQSSSAVHMLDQTGCQDFPSNDRLNRIATNASVKSNSAAEIRQAASIVTRGLQSAGWTYKWAEVPTTQALVTVRSSASHWYPQWPIPSYGTRLINTPDKGMLLVEATKPPDCAMWEGYDFTLGGGSWSAYSGFKVDSQTATPHVTCLGVASWCGENFEGDLTTWEANHGATNPILHAIHASSPRGMTCDQASGSQLASCIPIGSIIRLRASYPLPSDPNARAVLLAMENYGITVDDVSCCWAIYTMDNYNASLSIPSAVSSALSALRVTNFDVVNPP